MKEQYLKQISDIKEQSTKDIQLIDSRYKAALDGKADIEKSYNELRE